MRERRDTRVKSIETTSESRYEQRCSPFTFFLPPSAQELTSPRVDPISFSSKAGANGVRSCISTRHRERVGCELNLLARRGNRPTISRTPSRRRDTGGGKPRHVSSRCRRPHFRFSVRRIGAVLRYKWKRVCSRTTRIKLHGKANCASTIAWCNLLLCTRRMCSDSFAVACQSLEGSFHCVTCTIAS